MPVIFSIQAFYFIQEEPMTSTQQRAALQRQIWAIANDVRVIGVR